jgi:hypothetical protein
VCVCVCVCVRARAERVQYVCHTIQMMLFIAHGSPDGIGATADGRVCEVRAKLWGTILASICPQAVEMAPHTAQNRAVGKSREEVTRPRCRLEAIATFCPRRSIGNAKAQSILTRLSVHYSRGRMASARTSASANPHVSQHQCLSWGLKERMRLNGRKGQPCNWNRHLGGSPTSQEPSRWEDCCPYHAMQLAPMVHCGNEVKSLPTQ